MCRHEIVELAVSQEAANNETHQPLANIVSAAFAYRTTIASLIKTIYDLSTEFPNTNAAITALTKKMDNGKKNKDANSDGNSRIKENLN